MKWEALGDITLLIVDDDAFNRQLVVSLLSKIPTINFFKAEDGVEALDILTKKSVDMILLDLHMPKMNGYDTLKAIKREPNYDFIPIVIITTDEEEMNKLYSLGADDFISKPFKLTELESRIYAHIEKRQYRQKYNELSKNRIQKTLIESTPEEKNEETIEVQQVEKIETVAKDQEAVYTLDVVESSQQEIFYAMAKLLSKKDKRLESIQIVGTLAKALSLLVGYDKQQANSIYYATIIRNIGGVSLPNKTPSSYELLGEDRKIYHQCILLGYQLVNNAIDTEFIQISKRVIAQHKEHFDGSGFPQKHHGNQIHYVAYIVAIVETFDALLSEQGYYLEKIQTPEETYAVFKEQSGQRFHPKITKLFLAHFEYFIQLREKIIKQNLEKEHLET